MPNDDISQDITAMLSSLGLHEIRRYLDQYYWRQESQGAHAAWVLEGNLRLESVAEHSWHVADIALLLASRFPKLKRGRCLEIAILHDKLELLIGDMDPVGPDGSGSATHAFDPQKRARKDHLELEAMHFYLATLRVSERRRQRNLLLDIIYSHTPESRFVKVVDKLQAMCFILKKKGSAISEDCLRFTLRYASSSLTNFPELKGHFEALASIMISVAASGRGIDPDRLKAQVWP